MTPVNPLVTAAETPAVAAATPAVQSYVDKLLAKVSTNPAIKTEVDAAVTIIVHTGADLLAPLASKGLSWLVSKFGGKL